VAKQQKSPRRFLKRRGLLPAVRQSWKKNRPHNGRAGVVADLSIAGRAARSTEAFLVTPPLNYQIGRRGFLFREMIRIRWHRRHARSAVPAVATELDAEGADWREVALEVRNLAAAG
jgi:hypothetical protein